jgi:hypothetical protein
VAEDLSEWLGWCDLIGRKLLDEGISVDRILKHVILPKQIKARPALVPLTIEWSDYFLDADEDSVSIQIDGLNIPFVDVGLELTAHEDVGPLRFRLFTASKSVEYEVVFSNDTAQYRPMTTDARIAIGRRTKPLSEWFDEEPPIIRFENGAFLIHDDFAELPGDAIPPFSQDKIEMLDWAGVNLRKESQGSERSADSIQRRVIHYITDTSYVPQYDIVFDDDDTNESADIVAVKLDGEALRIDLFHCKYATTGRPTARVDDLYAVCGQVQRSVPWKGRHERLLKHLQNREASRLKRGGSTRFDRGNARLLSELTKRARRLRPEMTITLVQPGLSRAAAESSHLQLLAATELYLKETYAVAFRVLASP